MSTFGYYNPELEINIKFRVLGIELCQEFVAKYEGLPQHEYIFNVINMCIANADSELKPALAALTPYQADHTLLSIYNGCIMLNPVLDIRSWSEILMSYNIFDRTVSQHSNETPQLMPGPHPLPPYEHMFMEEDDDDVEERPAKGRPKKPFAINKTKLNGLTKFLKTQVIGQDEPIDSVFRALRRYQTGLADPHRPIGVFLFLGPSGVGKTLIAEKLHEYFFGNDAPMIALDCGEYQHKHENQRLLGSPPGYTGYEDGSILTKAMQHSNGGVILLDEVEKAHHDFWDTFLKVFEKGRLTDSKGNVLDFRHRVIIMTSNLGNEKVSESTYERQAGFTSTNVTGNYDSKAVPKRQMVERMTREAVRKAFRPELLNRLDEQVIFNHLSHDDYVKIANLQFHEVLKKLESREYSLTWSNRASDLLVEQSSKAMEGARSMERVRRRMVEDKLAELLNRTTFSKGKTFRIDAVNGEFVIK